MSLYVCVADDEGDFIVLNKKYKNKTKQLREKLLQNHGGAWVEYILKKGHYLDEPLVKKVCVKKSEARLTTQVRDYEFLFKKTQTIVVYPNANWRNATFLEKFTKQVNDGMWGDVLCTHITFGNKEINVLSNEYEKEEIKEQLLKKYSKEVVYDIMWAGRYRDHPQLIELSATREIWGIMEQYLEGEETRKKVFERKRWLVVYPNAFWRFATWKEIMSGTVLG